MIELVRDIVKEQLGTEGEKSDFDLLKLKSRRGRHYLTNYLIFGPGNHPIYFLKVGWEARYFEKVRKDYNGPVEVRRRVQDSEFLAGVPDPLYIGEHEGKLLSFFRAFEGVRLINKLKQDDGPLARRNWDLLLKCMDFLCAFQRLLKCETIFINDLEFDERVLAYLNKCAALLANSRAGNKVLEDVQMIRGIGLPLVMSHGDFNIYNFIKSPGTLFLHDWEEVTCKDLPFYDLFSLFFVYIFFFSSSIERTVPETYLSSPILRNGLSYYCDSMGIDIDIARVYLPVFLARAQLQLRDEDNSLRSDLPWAKILLAYSGGVGEW